MIEVNKEYISKAINNLYHLFGVKENISYSFVRKPFCTGKIEEGMETDQQSGEAQLPLDPGVPRMVPSLPSNSVVASSQFFP